MSIQRYQAGPVRRTVYMGVIALWGAGILVQLVALLHNLAQPADFKHGPLGIYVGGTLFVIAGSIAIVLFGVTGLTARLDVDTLGMRRERMWFSQNMDVSWDSIAAWGIRMIVTTYETNDGWNAQQTWTTVNYGERLEIEINRPPMRIALEPGAAFYREIVNALLAHVPDKEDSLSTEKA